MARRARPDRCRSCGDLALIDPDTFKPTGYCAACAAPAPKAAALARRQARLADREAVRVKPAPALCDVCGQAAPRPGYRHDVCADLVERGGDWPANMG